MVTTEACRRPNLPTTHFQAHPTIYPSEPHPKTYAEAANTNQTVCNSYQLDDLVTIFQKSFQVFENVIIQQRHQINSLLNLITTLITIMSNA